jgi:16S rRNA U516 pseudouridylate synthase RsuA-like enzyme
MADRIHKVLANAGYGSRREIETLIRNGKISVNGKLATIGQSIEAKDRVTINSRSIRLHLQNKKKTGGSCLLQTGRRSMYTSGREGTRYCF